MGHKPSVRWPVVSRRQPSLTRKPFWPQPKKLHHNPHRIQFFEVRRCEVLQVVSPKRQNHSSRSLPIGCVHPISRACQATLRQSRCKVVEASNQARSPVSKRSARMQERSPHLTKPHRKIRVQNLERMHGVIVRQA